MPHFSILFSEIMAIILWNEIEVVGLHSWQISGQFVMLNRSFELGSWFWTII